MIKTILSLTDEDFIYILTPTFYFTLGLVALYISKGIAKSYVIDSRIKNPEEKYNGFMLYITGFGIAWGASGMLHRNENVSFYINVIRNTLILLVPIYTGIYWGLKSAREMSKEEVLKGKLDS
ncbi:MAG: hypothetical protein JKY70_05825 [Mucilaginibacter sp.]|nr:hypothetical protein [Mucilaginibacter sp.]